MNHGMLQIYKKLEILKLMNQKGTILLVIVISAIILLIGLGWYFKGNLTQQKQTIPVVVKNQEDQNQPSKTSKKFSLDNFQQISTLANQTKVSFKCYKASELPSESKYLEVKDYLLKRNSQIDMLCSSSAFETMLVLSTDQAAHSSLDLYTVYPKDRDIPSPQVDTINLFIPKDSKKIQVNSWLSGGNIIFTHFDFDFSNFYVVTYVVKTPAMGGNNNLTPGILEKCDLSMKGNYLHIENCTSITINYSSSSSFFDAAELKFPK